MFEMQKLDQLINAGAAVTLTRPSGIYVVDISKDGKLAHGSGSNWQIAADEAIDEASLWQ